MLPKPHVYDLQTRAPVEAFFQANQLFYQDTDWALDIAEAQKWIAADARNAEVLFPYLNGEDLNSRPDNSADCVPAGGGLSGVIASVPTGRCR